MAVWQYKCLTNVRSRSWGAGRPTGLLLVAQAVELVQPVLVAAAFEGGFQPGPG